MQLPEFIPPTRFRFNNDSQRFEMVEVVGPQDFEVEAITPMTEDQTYFLNELIQELEGAKEELHKVRAKSRRQREAYRSLQAAYNEQQRLILLGRAAENLEDGQLKSAISDLSSDGVD